MATDADLYALFGGDDATAQEQALALAAALRRQRDAGNLALLTGDKVLGGYGQAQLRAADGTEGALAQAGGQRAGRRLQELLGKRQQDFAASQAQASQAFQAREHALTRGATRENLELELGARRANSERMAEAAKTKAQREATESLRKELQGRPEFKQFQEVRAGYRTFKDAVRGTTGADGVTAIFSFMKMLDPGVAVMEGDVNLIKRSGGPAAQYADWYNYALTGNPLPAKVRKDLEARADGIYGTKSQLFGELAKQYEFLAEKAGADSSEIIHLPEDNVRVIDGKRYTQQPDGQWAVEE